METRQKHIGVLMRTAPYGNVQAQEALEALLGISTYGQVLSLIFMDDGVFQLVKGQQADKLGRKSLEKMLSALEFYDIDPVYVCQSSLSERSLTIEQLTIPCQVLDTAAINMCLRQQDTLLAY